MAIPNEAIKRQERYLAKIAGQESTLPEKPIARKEFYLAKAAGQSVETPEPITREEMYLDAIAEGGGGGDANAVARSILEGTVTEYVDPLLTSVSRYAFSNSALNKFICHNVEAIGASAFAGSKIEKIAFPNINSAISTYAFSEISTLSVVDFGPDLSSSIGGGAFASSANFKTLILRCPTIVALSSAAVFNGTPFRTGNSGGGTIYIPKVLYDQLGTGTNDYQSFTNWSTMHGYGHITWAQIEGSYYETHYGDDTLIPTA